MQDRSTVRDWLARLASRAELIRGVFTVWLCALDADPPPLLPAGSPAADAVAAITAAAGAARRRWAGRLVSLSPGELTPLRAPGTADPAQWRPAGGVRPVRGGRPNELWTDDALHGPVIGGRKTYLLVLWNLSGTSPQVGRGLYQRRFPPNMDSVDCDEGAFHRMFAFIDDHSRLITGHRFGHAEDTVRLAAALRPALASHGVPEAIYVDYADPGGNGLLAGVNGPKISA